MKNGVIRIYLSSLVIALMSFSGINASDNNWDVEIALSKQDYVLHEAVVLDVILTNATSDDLRTYGLIQPNHRDFYILLTDSEGKEMKYTGPQSYVAGGPGELLLDAGEQDYEAFNLLELFGSIRFDSGYKVSCTRFPFMPKGTYTVKVYYDGDFSNELTFTVVEPFGQEVEVLRKIEQASQIWLQTDTDPSSRIYGEVPRNYPNSAFAEKCYYLSRFFSQEIFDGYGSGSYDKRILKSEMLSKYPNSGQVKAWLESITFRKSEHEQMAIYDELIAENPNTRCSKIASLLKERMLAKREAGE